MKNKIDTDRKCDLNLDRIKAKLMHVESGEGWPINRAEAAEMEYRRFLILMKAFPNEQASPSVEVDTFWHYHILDTVKYAADCESFFGYFLHHNPDVGMQGDNAHEIHRQAGERMCELYAQVFGAQGPSHSATSAFCGAQAIASFCGAGTRASSVAFCGATAKRTAASAAFCGASSGISASDHRSQFAFDGAGQTVASLRNGDGIAQQAAFCGATGRGAA